MRWLAVLAALFMLASPALALHPCGPRSAFIERLWDKYGETPVGQGLTNPNNQLMELFTSKDGGTWTLLLTLPNGCTRIIGVGKDWRAVPPALLKPMGLPV